MGNTILGSEFERQMDKLFNPKKKDKKKDLNHYDQWGYDEEHKTFNDEIFNKKITQYQKPIKKCKFLQLIDYLFIDNKHNSNLP